MKKIIINLSGSYFINLNFLKKFRKLILQESKKYKIIIITGGGETCKKYQEPAREFRVSQKSLDLIGIQATRLNAEFLKAILPKTKIFSGTKPGWSTDYVSVKLAKKFRAKQIICATNIDYIYDKDPKKFKNAKKLKSASFEEYQQIIPKKWSAGLKLPFDPIATKLAKKLKLQIKLLKADNIKNLRKAINNQEFQGSVIE